MKRLILIPLLFFSLFASKDLLSQQADFERALKIALPNVSFSNEEAQKIKSKLIEYNKMSIIEDILSLQKEKEALELETEKRNDIDEKINEHGKTIYYGIYFNIKEEEKSQEFLEKNKSNYKEQLSGSELKLIEEGAFDFIDSFSDGLAAVKLNNKYGFVDLEYNIVIPIEYQKVYLKENVEVILAKKDGKWGLINREGKIVVPFIYDRALQSGITKNGIASLYLNGESYDVYPDGRLEKYNR